MQQGAGAAAAAALLCCCLPHAAAVAPAPWVLPYPAFSLDPPQPIDGGTFEVVFAPGATKSSAAVRIVRNGSCGAGEPTAEGGALKAIDASGRVSFNLLEPVGTYHVCVLNAPGEDQLYAGEVNIRPICFHPRLALTGFEPVQFNSATPENAEWALAGTSSCNSRSIKFEGRLQNRTAAFVPRSGFICIKWHVLGSWTWVYGDRIVVSPEPMSFYLLPAQPLTNQPQSVAILDLPTDVIRVPGARVVVSQDKACTQFVNEPTPLIEDPQHGAYATFDPFSVPGGLYFICVESSREVCATELHPRGSFVQIPGDFVVHALDFSPTTIITQTNYTITFTGPLQSFGDTVKFVQGNCTTGFPVVEGLKLRQGAVHAVVPAGGTFNVCVSKIRPFTEYLHVGTLEVLVTFEVDIVKPLVRGTAALLQIGGGAARDAEVAISSSDSCLNAVAGPKRATNYRIEFPVIFPAGPYFACIKMTRSAEWVSVRTLTARNFDITPEGTFIVGRPTSVSYDSAMPQEGLNLTFVMRGQNPTDNCAAALTDPTAVSVRATPAGSPKVTLPSAGLWDICEMDVRPGQPLYLKSFSVVAPYSFIPVDSLLHTPTVLVFGTSVPRGHSIIVVGREPSDPPMTEASCQAAYASGASLANLTVDPLGQAVLSLDADAGFRTGVRYEVCVDASDNFYLPASGGLSLHNMTERPEGPFRLQANISRVITFSGWPLENLPDYRSGEPAIAVSDPRKVRVVRGFTDEACRGSDGDIALLVLGAAKELHVVIQEAPVNISFCVEVPLSDYLRGRNVSGWQLYPSGVPPRGWLRAGTAIVVKRIVIEPPRPDWPISGSVAVRYVPFAVKVAGGVQAGSPVKVTVNSTCQETVAGGEEREVNETFQVDFTLYDGPATFWLCAALPRSIHFAPVVELTVLDLRLGPIRDLWAGGGPRTVSIGNASFAGVSQVIAVYGTACPRLSRVEQAAVVPPVNATMGAHNDSTTAVASLRLPGSAQGRELLLCAIVVPPTGSAAGEDTIPIVGTIRGMALPTFTAEPPTRFVRWPIRVSGAGHRPDVFIALGGADECSARAPRMARFGEIQQVAADGYARFLLAEADRSRVQVCAAVAGTGYYASCGSAYMQPGFWPFQVLHGRRTAVRFPYTIEGPALIKIAPHQNCSGAVWGPEAMDPGPPGENEARIVGVSVHGVRGSDHYLCVESSTFDALFSERRAQVMQVTGADVQLPADVSLPPTAGPSTTPLRWHEVGHLHVVPRFAAVWSSKLVAPGESVDLRVTVPERLSRQVILANDSDCMWPGVPGGEETLLSPSCGANCGAAAFRLPDYWGTQLTACVRTLDTFRAAQDGNWVPAAGESPLFLAFEMPQPLLRCCSVEPYTVHNIPLPWGQLYFSTMANCSSGRDLYPAQIFNGTASVRIPQMPNAQGLLWACLSGAPAGQVRVMGPPTYAASPPVALQGEPFLLTLGHPTADLRRIRARVYAGAGGGCSNVRERPIAEFNQSAVITVSNASVRSVRLCGLLPDFPGDWITLSGNVTVNPFLPPGDLEDPQLESQVPQWFMLPGSHFRPPRRWIARLHSAGDTAECSDPTVWGPMVSDPEGRVLIVAKGPIRMAALCIHSIPANETRALSGNASVAELDAISARAGPPRLVARFRVWHAWHVSVSPTLIPALRRSPLHLKGNTPTETRVRLGDTKQCTSASVGTAVEGNRTDAEGTFIAVAPPGQYHVCVETVFAHDWVSAGVIEVYNVAAAAGASTGGGGADGIAACVPFYFLITGLGVDTERVRADLERGQPGQHGCSCDTRYSVTPAPPEFEGVDPPVVQESLSANVSVAKGLALNASFIFPVGVEDPLLLCVRYTDPQGRVLCMELADLPNGVPAAGCYTPAPSEDGTGTARIGGAFDKVGEEDFPLGALIALAVVLPLCCSIIAAGVAWWKLKKPERKKGLTRSGTPTPLGNADGDVPSVDPFFPGSSSGTAPLQLPPPPGTHAGGNGGVRRPLSAFGGAAKAPPPPITAGGATPQLLRDLEGTQITPGGDASAWSKFNLLSGPPPSVSAAASPRAWQQHNRGCSPQRGAGTSLGDALFPPGTAGLPPGHYATPSAVAGASLGGIALEVPSGSSFYASKLAMHHNLQQQAPRLIDSSGSPRGLHLSARPPAPGSSPPRSPLQLTAASPVARSEAAASVRSGLYGQAARSPAGSPRAEAAALAAGAAAGDALARRWVAAQRQQREHLAELEGRGRTDLHDAEESAREALILTERRERRDGPVRRRQSRLRAELQDEEHQRALRQHAERLDMQEEAEREARQEERRGRAAAMAQREAQRREQSARQNQEGELHERQLREQERERQALAEAQRAAEAREQEERQRERAAMGAQRTALQAAAQQRLQQSLGELAAHEETARSAVAADESGASGALLRLEADARGQLARLSQQRAAQRAALVRFEEEARCKEAAQEKLEREAAAEAEAEGRARIEQVELLIEAQRTQDLARRAEAARKLEEEEESRRKLEEERAQVALARQRVEEERHLVESTRRQQAEEEHRRKAELLRRQAVEEERLREENLLLAERAREARAAHERAKREVEEERRRVEEERRRVAEQARRAEEERREQNALAAEAERRRLLHEQAVARQREGEHRRWLDRVALQQGETRVRQELRQGEGQGRDRLLGKLESSLAEAAARMRAAREAEERAREQLRNSKRKDASMIGGDFYQTNRVQRLKDSSADLLHTLAAIVPPGTPPPRPAEGLPAPPPYSAQAVQASIHALEPSSPGSSRPSRSVC